MCCHKGCVNIDSNIGWKINLQGQMCDLHSLFPQVTPSLGEQETRKDDGKKFFLFQSANYSSSRN